MCQFLSYVVTKTGETITAPEHTDSHEDLIAFANLRENLGGSEMLFVRCELTPGEHWGDPSKWMNRLDEQSRPKWFTEKVEKKHADKMRLLAKKMIVTDGRRILLGGCWILMDEAKVETAKHVRVVIMSGSSQVGSMSGPSQVGVMYDASQVGSMSGSSRVGVMYDASQVGVMYDASQVGSMSGSSRVVNDKRIKKKGGQP